ncbi:potassium channel family protein [Tuwongella immobilis]|uniref:RCK C-terminal domain-containing protein n=1 Tax=Tuwongella immobilis TaxID=692036 RepID=A0A6C2YHA1_9BACT|nr:NAD-binding protein [Tuwongella immobilis]VIP00866.1 potassium channel protein : TrkA-N domain protein OS=Cyanobacterium stanieri (strain ATCC 29140 / PCC 7202) GN=Cyast_1228 PE=4 SV=1: TrkA_N: TrkA_C: TrkA_N [Tuwongella immobilis]VTR97150.1 potassium channel protein : TrkA-N domain protein OS=Cyanobacterium stanieri (strain ATCC 29140 / PCC 7202) GN=Cyast_1228 PE=4 SV=1: TrkA_N: TrkA_C: TrkA_N [Tuwongella immobilis]
MNAPIILCGLGLVGRRVYEHLLSLDRPLVIIDSRINPQDPLYHRPHVRVVVGDCRDPVILEQAGVPHARGVLILTSDDLVNIATGLMVRRLNPDVRIVLRMFNQNLINRLGRSVRNIVALSVSALAGPRLAMRALDRDVVTGFDNLEFGPQQIVEMAITPESPLANRRIGDIVHRERLVTVGYQPGEGESRILLEINPDQVLMPGDRIWLAGTAKRLDRLRLESGQLSDRTVSLPGKLRHAWRMARRAVDEIDWTVKLGTGLLLGTVCFCTLVYHWVFHRPLADSLYRTISVIATGADMRGYDFANEEFEGGAKVFISIMRLSGVALLAAFTAIITNFLVRARLGGVLEVRRIPDWGHVVVCGLGNIGFRVVEELLRRGERVVVIEPLPNNPFVPTVRREGVAVIQGEATISEVLRQANIATARAVITCTPNELINLEIALLVAEIQPNQRVVLRMADPLLAETVRESGLVPLAVSVPTLAAPLIVGAMFDEHVQSVFRIHGRELVLVDLTVQPNDPCLDRQSLRAVAIDYDLIPLGLVPIVQSTTPLHASVIDSRNYRLKAGDRMTVLTTPASLARLVQREPAPAVWRVEITGFPLPQRETLALYLRSVQNLTQADADAKTQQLPLTLAHSLTRGQAEDWHALLQRERIAATITPHESE